MNNDRRKDIRRAIALLEEIQGKLDEARGILEDAGNAEQEYCDNMPPNMADSEKALAAQNAADVLSAVVERIDDLNVDQTISDLGDILRSNTEPSRILNSMGITVGNLMLYPLTTLPS